MDRQQVVEFEDGEMLHKMQYRVLFDNDQFFHAWADRWLPVPNGVVRTNTVTNVVWDGYLLLQSDAKTLHYHIEAGTDAVVQLYFDYGGGGQVLIATANNTNPIQAGTYDLSGFAAGLYRIYCRNTGTSGTTGTCHAPWASYTGGLSYTTPPTITDGLVSAATQFNKWRSNDAYFEAQMSPNVPTNGPNRGHVGDELSLVIWDGFVIHSEDQRRLRYKCQLSSVLNSNHLKCIYDYDAVVSKQTLVDISDTDMHESYADAPASTYTPGNTYRVVWQMTRANHAYGNVAKGRVYYNMLGPVSAHSGFTVPGELTANQYVYGDTAIWDTRAELLSLNDADINGRQGMVRRDYAVRKAEYNDLGGSGGTWRYYFMRQRDVLYYRATSATLSWGDDDSQALDDYGGAGYQTLDLRSLRGLAPGAGYWIEGTMEFAAEM